MLKISPSFQRWVSAESLVLRLSTTTPPCQFLPLRIYTHKNTSYSITISNDYSPKNYLEKLLAFEKSSILRNRATVKQTLMGSVYNRGITSYNVHSTKSQRVLIVRISAIYTVSQKWPKMVILNDSVKTIRFLMIWWMSRSNSGVKQTL